MAEERVQRRLAAILAADVAVCSQLMAEDEEGTLVTLTIRSSFTVAGPKTMALSRRRRFQVIR